LLGFTSSASSSVGPALAAIAAAVANIESSKNLRLLIVPMIFFLPLN
jgi:hypothetical protein